MRMSVTVSSSRVYNSTVGVNRTGLTIVVPNPARFTSSASAVREARIDRSLLLLYAFAGMLNSTRRVCGIL